MKVDRTNKQPRVKDHSRVARKNCRPHFFRGLSLIESVPGESRVLTRRIERSTVFPEWKLSVYLIVKKSLSKNACPDSRSGLVLRLSGLERNSLYDSYLPRAWLREDYFSSILSQSPSFVSRVTTFLTIFWLKKFLGNTVSGRVSLFRAWNGSVGHCGKR